MNSEGWGASGVSVRFGARQALDRVSISALPGQVTAVVGADGAGKTTLLRCIAGALAPGEGTVRRPDARRTGYLPPGAGVYEDLSVAENLRFRSASYGIPAPEAERHVSEYLERTGLAEARDRLAGQLSGGMLRKLGVIAALLPEPDLLVLDEPTTGVDPVSRADLWWARPARADRARAAGPRSRPACGASRRTAGRPAGPGPRRALSVPGTH